MIKKDNGDTKPCEELNQDVNIEVNKLSLRSLIFVKDGKVLITSQNIAELLVTHNDEVIKIIDALACSDDFRKENFFKKSESLYELTFNGLSMIIDSFEEKEKKEKLRMLGKEMEQQFMEEEEKVYTNQSLFKESNEKQPNVEESSESHNNKAEKEECIENESIIIDDEFKNLLQPLSEDEYKRLEESIKTEGCRDALVVWKDKNIIVDGHNRYEICKAHNFLYETIEKEFKNRLEVKVWIIENQLARRNFTDLQKTYHIGLLYKNMKKIQGGTGENSHTIEQTGQNVQSATTAQELANQYKVDEKTIRRAEKVTNAIDTIVDNIGQPTKEIILTREIPLTQKDILAIAELQPEEQKEIVSKLVDKTQSLSKLISCKNKQSQLQEDELSNEKYDVILVNTLWQEDYFKQNRDKVEHISSEDSILFIFVTGFSLERGLKVLKWCKFKYESCVICMKDNQHYELLLLGVKGKMDEPLENIPSIINEPIYKIIEKSCPNRSYLQLFASEEREGWSSLPQ